jgi:kynurenine formamidase
VSGGAVRGAGRAQCPGPVAGGASPRARSALTAFWPYAIVNFAAFMACKTGGSKPCGGMSGGDPDILLMARMARLVPWRNGRRRCACVSATLLGYLLLQTAAAWAGALERAMLGKSTVVDLTHIVGEPSPRPERPQLDAPGEREGAHDGADAVMDSGTQLRAGSANGREPRTVAQIPSDELFVSAVVVNIKPKVAKSPDYQATVEDLRAWERQNGRIPRRTAVLLNTGWSRWWADPARYVNQDAHGVPKVPGFSPAAVAFLVGERQVRGLGVDALIPHGDSISPVLSAGLWQLENLANLDRLPAKGAKLVVAPIRMEAAAAPVRVIAILP